jgi:hypothetical protein
MKFHVISIMLICCLFAPVGAQDSPNDQPSSSLYLGQKPPGLTPELFMPGFVSTDDHVEMVLAVSSNGDELYFMRGTGGRNTILFSHLTDDGWSEPEPATFLNEHGAFEHHVSPTSDRMYFSRISPPPGMKLDGPPKTREEEAMMIGVWYIDRSDSGWSAPVYAVHGMYVTTTNDGTVYTTDIHSPVGVACSRLIDGKYGELKRLGGGVNDPAPGAHPCVAHDESFVIFDSEREGGEGGEDLYVCFRQSDGSWGAAKNLGAGINTSATDFCPSLSPDGNYLFFASDGDIYWVDAAVIEALKE